MTTRYRVECKSAQLVPLLHLTPLHKGRGAMPSFAVYLLDYGANLNLKMHSRPIEGTSSSVCCLHSVNSVWPGCIGPLVLELCLQNQTLEGDRLGHTQVNLAPFNGAIS